MENLLNQKQQNYLLNLARNAIKFYLEKKKNLKISPEEEIYKEKRGAFVTLKKNGELRGCIGYPLPVKSLHDTVIETAVASATEDPRFPSLTLNELSEINIEISVLSLPRPVKDPSEVKIGKHGIIISKGLLKGLLLPQVPVEWNWDLDTYLRHGCLKAGLNEDEWKKGAKIEIFSAQVFSEPTS